MLVRLSSHLASVHGWGDCLCCSAWGDITPSDCPFLVSLTAHSLCCHPPLCTRKGHTHPSHPFLSTALLRPWLLRWLWPFGPFGLVSPGTTWSLVCVCQTLASPALGRLPSVYQPGSPVLPEGQSQCGQYLRLPFSWLRAHYSFKLSQSSASVSPVMTHGAAES